MTTRIKINGTEYDSPETMPPEVRALYQKAMDLARNGSNAAATGPKVNVKVSTKMRFVHEGKTYENLDDLPLEVRARYEAAVGRLDKDHNGVPDILGRGQHAPEVSAASSLFDVPSTLQPTPSLLGSQSPVIAPERTNRAFIAIAGVLILLLLLGILGILAFVFVR